MSALRTCHTVGAPRLLEMNDSLQRTAGSLNLASGGFYHFAAGLVSFLTASASRILPFLLDQKLLNILHRCTTTSVLIRDKDNMFYSLQIRIRRHYSRLAARLESQQLLRQCAVAGFPLFRFMSED